MSPRAKETIYMCMVKVIEYKIETQTIQCHLEGYFWKKVIIQLVSSRKGIAQVVGPCTSWTSAVYIVREIRNHILGYSWQMDNMLGGWALYTPHMLLHIAHHEWPNTSAPRREPKC